MGMSTNVVGFRAEDEEWDRMKKVWNACREAGVPIPKEVHEFFDFTDPNEDPGREVPLGDALCKWEDGTRQGFQVDIEDLPPGLRYLRFYVSW